MMTSLLLKFLALYVGLLPVYAAPNLLSQGPGAVGAALGRSAVSVIQDPTSLYWNPAGLAGADGAVTGEHLFLYDGARYDFAGLSVPSRYGSFGLGALQLYRGDIIARRAIDDPGYTVSASQADYMAGYAKGFGEHWSAGGTFNTLDSNLAGRHDRGMGADVGGRFAATSDDAWFLSRPHWSAGAVIKNLLAPSLKLDQDPEALPRELRGGVSVSFDGLSRLSLNAGEIHKDRAMLGVGFSKVMGETELRLGVGASYTLQDVLTLRLSLDDGFALGVGLKTVDGRFSLDYAIEDRPLTKNHRFTLTYRFLKPAAPATAPATTIEDEEYARAKARSEALGDEAFTRGQELFKANRYDDAEDSLAMAVLLKPEDGAVREMSRRAVEVRERATASRLRETLDQQVAAGDAVEAYGSLAKLLRDRPEDRERLLEQARHMAERMDMPNRVAVSTTLAAAGMEAVHAELARGLDAQALSDAIWIEAVAIDSQTAVLVHDLHADASRRAAEHRRALEGAIEQRRKAGDLRGTLLAALSLKRSYPEDAAAASSLDTARQDYAATLRLTPKDRLYERKLYYLAAVAWSKRDAERARDLLDELRRRDATDPDAAALMDAMVRAGAVYETFANNGGGQ
jgi:hypothetical protein